MNDDQRAEEIRRLETLVAGPAGALAFPVLAEAQRRAGRPDEAERVARAGLERTPHATAGRVALALALLDQKRGEEACAELERLLGSDPEHAIAREAVAAEAPEGVAERPGEAGPAASEPLDLEPAATAALRGGEIATLDPYPEEPVGPLQEDLSDDLSDPAPGLGPAVRGPFGRPPPPAPAEPLMFDAGDVRDDELDDAFEAAESDREQMLGADDVARAAISAVPDEDDGDAELDPSPRVAVAEGEDEFARPAGFAVPSEPRASVGLAVPSAPQATLDTIDDGLGGRLSDEPDSPFATETVAGLLERQGHGEEANRLRERMAAPESACGAEAAASEMPPDRRRQATLERWLENLRRDES